MVTNYNQKEVTGQEVSWTRCCRVEIENTLSEVPIATFYEEVATTLPDSSTLTKKASSIVLRVADMTTSFPLLNPATGEQIGTMTYGQLYAGLASCYLAVALARDAQQG